MKNNDQSGFILMIIIMAAIALSIIGFAVYRITKANPTTLDAYNSQHVYTLEHESTSV